MPPSVFRPYPPPNTPAQLRAALSATTYDPGGRPNWTPWHNMTAWPMPDDGLVVMCAVPKAGSSAVKAMGAHALTIHQTADALARADVLRVALVRDPVTRFLSWYRDKVERPNAHPGPAYYNRALCDTNETAALPATAYAAALLRGVDTVEPHLRTQTHHCALNLIHFDIVHPLEQADSLTARVAAALDPSRAARVNTVLPHSNVGVGPKSELDSPRLRSLIRDAYSRDYAWIARHGVHY